MFDYPTLLISGILATGLVFVVVPVAIDAHHKYRFRKVINCPETRGLAEVNLNARLVALGAGVGRPVLRVKNCSLWPKRKGCDERCVRENWPTP